MRTKPIDINGRVNNLEYGSYAPGAPNVFVGDDQFTRLWKSEERHYLVLEGPELPKIEVEVEAVRTRQ